MWSTRGRLLPMQLHFRPPPPPTEYQMREREEVEYGTKMEKRKEDREIEASYQWMAPSSPLNEKGMSVNRESTSPSWDALL